MTSTSTPRAISPDDARAALADVLAGMAGPEATARDGQAEAVVGLVVERGRVLVVQATGWGKSAVYWAATRANRAAGHGPTVVVSPLLALMRDQIDAAARAGVAASTINSSNTDEWDDVYARLQAGEVDVLLISPERLGSPSFAARLGELSARIGMVVIDEAHCISDWGHDFRPDYQRIAGALLRAGDVPVLATTATANSRVTADVAAQLGATTTVIRGGLARSSLRLDVVDGLDATQRWAWVSAALGEVAGSGIVYALTVAEAERLASFLQHAGHDAVAYTGQLDTEARAAIEARLQANQVKAVVATSALGMGYDKADLAFCFHVGSPSSPVAMYQQVGRAGRAIDDAVAVLLPAETDERLWEYFATAGIPDPELAARVLEHLGHGPASVPAIESVTGARRGRLDALLRVLAVDGAVVRGRNGWESTGEPWVFDRAKYAALRTARDAEAALMRSYARKQRCLMLLLQEALDDPDPAPCGRCGVCTGAPVLGASPTPEAVEQVRDWMRDQPTRIEPRKMWPSGVDGWRGRIAGCDEGRAIAFAADPAWPEVIAEVSGGIAGEASVAAALRVLGAWRREWAARPTLVVPLPGPDGGRYATQLAEAIGTAGKLPVAAPLRWHGTALTLDSASAPRVRALLERLSIAGETAADDPIIDDSIADDPIIDDSIADDSIAGDLIGALGGATVLLVAAEARTGWTTTLAAALLRRAGADRVLPLVAHQHP